MATRFPNGGRTDGAAQRIALATEGGGEINASTRADMKACALTPLGIL